MRGHARWFGIALLLGIIVAGLAAGAFYQLFERPGPLGSQAIVVIPKGAGVSAIARLLDDRGIISSALAFRVGVRVTGNHSRLRAGEFAIPARASARDVMNILISGKTVVRRLTIPEGLTSAQVAESVNAAYGLTGQPVAPPPEGSVLPDTYHYSYGDTRAGLIKRMQTAMTRNLDKMWKARASGLPLDSPRDAVILASIVEKETGLGPERPLIAGVFINRLRKGMPLQSDPTVAYAVAREEGLPDEVLDRPLTRKDLETPDPYNTYLHKGLPPGPITNPGRKALAAVLHPAATDALYFVADGTGGHVFSRTLAEHDRNVRRWRRLEHERESASTPGP